MVYGFDYSGVISKYPKRFKKLATALLAQGDTVYIVSAKRHENVAKLRQDIKHFPCTRLEVVVHNDYLKIPELKLRACKRLGIRVMFDDREDICKLLSENGIMTGQIR